MSTTTAFTDIAAEVLRRVYQGRPLVVETSASSGGGAGTLHIPNKAFESWSANMFDGCGIYAVGVTAPNEARVTRGGYSTSTGIAVFDIHPDMGTNPNSSKTIWFTYGLTRQHILNAVNNVITNLYAPAWLPWPNLVTDGDMETTGVTNWTSIGSPGTKEKVTTASRVIVGKQALHVAGDTDEGVICDSIAVHEQESIVWSATVMVDTGKVKVQLWDVTNSVAIREVETIETEGYAEVIGHDTVPADCKFIAIRVIAEEDTTDFYVGWAQVLSASRTVYSLPSTFDNSWHIKELFYYADRYSSGVDDVYIPFSGNRQFMPFSKDGLRDYQGANSFKIELPRQWTQWPVFAELRREDAALSVDADTTTVPKEIVVNGAVSELYKFMANTFRPSNPGMAEEYDKMSGDAFMTYKAQAVREGLIKEVPEVAARWPMRVRG